MPAADMALSSEQMLGHDCLFSSVLSLCPAGTCTQARAGWQRCGISVWGRRDARDTGLAQVRWGEEWQAGCRGDRVAAPRNSMGPAPHPSIVRLQVSGGKSEKVRPLAGVTASISCHL